MASVDVATLKEGLAKYFATPEMKAAIAAFGDGPSLRKAIAIALEGVKIVEKLAADAGAVAAGSEKRKALVSYIDDCIDLPFYLEALDGVVIGIVIDALVGWYNLKHGKDWINKGLAYL
jgi:hypothetical protein